MAWNPCSLCRGITIHFAVEWLFSLRGIRSIQLEHSVKRHTDAGLAIAAQALRKRHIVDSPDRSGEGR
jgi:hypothetical protein